MQQLDLQKRLLIALVLSFLVFLIYDIISPQKREIDKKIESNKTINNGNNIIPEIINSSSPKIINNSEKVKNILVPNSISSLVKINSKKFIIDIDKLGRISKYQLLENKYKTENNKILSLFNPLWIKPLEIRFADSSLNEEALKVKYTSSLSKVVLSEDKSKVIILQQKLSKTTVTKKIIFYQDGHFDIDIQLSTPEQFFITIGERPDADHTAYMVVQGSLVKKNDNNMEIIEDGDGKDAPSSFINAKFMASFDRYYTSILYDFKNGINISTLIKNENALLFIQAKKSISLSGYIGPRESKVLKRIHPELTDALEYGWFTFIAKPLFNFLSWLNLLFNNWGWSIIFLTILVKLILFPLSYKGMMSMQKLKDLAPKMKDIKNKYGKEPQKMNMHMMELYKKNNANPLGGCLPIILQIPIFFAIYRVLLNAVELQGAEWILWINDLSKYDSFFILPILMGASMWYQQKITPNTMTDPLQQKIFQWLPIIMTLFFLTFPAGLVLYWLINNILTIIQQYIINKTYNKK